MSKYVDHRVLTVDEQRNSRQRRALLQEGVDARYKLSLARALHPLLVASYNPPGIRNMSTGEFKPAAELASRHGKLGAGF